MASNRWIATAAAGAIALSAGIVLATTGDAFGDNGGTGPVADSSDNNFDNAADLLTVTRADTQVSCVQLVKDSGRATEDVSEEANREVRVYAWELGINADNLLATDSYRTGFAAADDEGKQTELFTENCLDPLGAGDALNFWANFVLPDGTPLVNRNPWLAPWVGDPAAVINTAAAQYMPLYLNEASLSWVQVEYCVPTETKNCLEYDEASKEKVRQAIQAQYNWQVIAGRLNTLIRRTEMAGVQEGRVSVLNYHLLEMGLVVPSRDAAGNLVLPRIGFNDVQEDLPALVYRVTEKDNPCPLLEFGFNTGDKRFELFTPTCEEQPPVPPTNPTGTNPPGTTAPPTGSTVPPGTTVPGQTTVPGPTTTVPGPTTTAPPTTTPPTTAPPTTAPPTTVSPTTTIPEPPCVPGPDEIIDENGECIHIEIPDPDPCASHPEMEIDVCQPPQDNDPDDVNPTPGAPEEPNAPPPEDGTPPPDPNDGGYDSGTGDGTGTPGGSECDEAGNCTGGNSDPDEDGNEPVVEDDPTVITDTVPPPP